MSIERPSRTKLCAILAVSSLLVAGCTDKTPFTPTVDEYVVHAVLDAGERRQFVVIEHSDGIPSEQAPVPTANVTLTTPSGRVYVARLVRDTVWAYSAPGTPASVNYVRFIHAIDLSTFGDSLVPGATYALRVRVNSVEITGETTIPNASAVGSAPISTDTLYRDRDTLALAWAQSTGARPHHLLMSESGVVRYATFASQGVSLLGTMTMLNVRNNKQEPVFVPNVSYDVSVLAVDANYYNYFVNGSGSAQSSASAAGSLRGALGLFGSVVRVNRRRVVVR